MVNEGCVGLTGVRSWADKAAEGSRKEREPGATVQKGRVLSLPRACRIHRVDRSSLCVPAWQGSTCYSSRPSLKI